MLISEDYKTLNHDMHVKKPNWGNASTFHAPAVKAIIEKYGFKTILDYGCGRMRLRDALKQSGLNVEVNGYDPCVPEHDKTPDPQDFVCCLDVLEHVEPEYVDAVLDDLKRVTAKLGLFTIATGPANRLLPDGTNPHRTIRPAQWWLDKLSERFRIVDSVSDKKGLGVWVFRK